MLRSGVSVLRPPTASCFACMLAVLCSVSLLVFAVEVWGKNAEVFLLLEYLGAIVTGLVRGVWPLGLSSKAVVKFSWKFVVF
jgi:hypothetical protein